MMKGNINQLERNSVVKITVQFLLALAFIIMQKPVASLAQEQSHRSPDYEEIEQQVVDPNSPYYYPEILQRFLAQDTTLTVDDFHYFYYGYVFQKAYKNPWGLDSINLVYLKEIQAAELNESNYDTYIQLSKESLHECPVNPFALNMLVYLYGLKNDEATSRGWTYMSAGLTNAIFASGDGKTCETGFHIVLHGHLNYFMSLLEVRAVPTPIIDEHYRCEEVDFGGHMSLYFNVEKIHKANWEYLIDGRKAPVN